MVKLHVLRLFSFTLLVFLEALGERLVEHSILERDGLLAMHQEVVQLVTRQLEHPTLMVLLVYESALLLNTALRSYNLLLHLFDTVLASGLFYLKFTELVLQDIVDFLHVLFLLGLERRLDKLEAIYLKEVIEIANIVERGAGKVRLVLPKVSIVTGAQVDHIVGCNAFVALQLLVEMKRNHEHAVHINSATGLRHLQLDEAVLLEA